MSKIIIKTGDFEEDYRFFIQSQRRSITSEFSKYTKGAKIETLDKLLECKTFVWGDQVRNHAWLMNQQLSVVLKSVLPYARYVIEKENPKVVNLLEQLKFKISFKKELNYILLDSELEKKAKRLLGKSNSWVVYCVSDDPKTPRITLSGVGYYDYINKCLQIIKYPIFKAIIRKEKK